MNVIYGLAVRPAEAVHVRPVVLLPNQVKPLTEVLQNLYRIIKPCEADYKLRIKAIETVIDVVEKVSASYCNISCHGSFSLDLYLRTSDIDLTVALPNHVGRHNFFQAMERRLKEEGVAEKVQVISSATVPIIRFQMSASGVDVDLSAKPMNYTGFNWIVKRNQLEFKNYRKLVLTMKHLVQWKEIDSARYGLLSSFRLLLLINGFVKQNQHLRYASLGFLVLEFLKFSVNFDIEKYYIASDGSINAFTHLMKMNTLYMQHPVEGSFTGTRVWHWPKVSLVLRKSYIDLIDLCTFRREDESRWPHSCVKFDQVKPFYYFSQESPVSTLANLTPTDSSMTSSPSYFSCDNN